MAYCLFFQLNYSLKETIILNPFFYMQLFNSFTFVLFTFDKLTIQKLIFNFKSYLFYADDKDYYITGRANPIFSVQLAYAKFLSKIKENF